MGPAAVGTSPKGVVGLGTQVTNAGVGAGRLPIPALGKAEATGAPGVDAVKAVRRPPSQTPGLVPFRPVMALGVGTKVVPHVVRLPQETPLGAAPFPVKTFPVGPSGAGTTTVFPGPRPRGILARPLVGLRAVRPADGTFSGVGVALEVAAPTETSAETVLPGTEAVSPVGGGHPVLRLAPFPGAPGVDAFAIRLRAPRPRPDAVAAP